MKHIMIAALVLLPAIAFAGIDRSADVASIRKLLMNVEGITVESDGDKIIIDGELLTSADRARVRRVTAGYADVLDLTTMSKLVR